MKIFYLDQLGLVLTLGLFPFQCRQLPELYLPIKVPALQVELQLRHGMISPSQRRDIPAQPVQYLQLRQQLGSCLAQPPAQDHGVLPGQHRCQVIGEFVPGHLAHFLGAGGYHPGIGEEVLPGLPFAKAALAPFAEVLLGDDGAAEERRQYLAGFRQVIEPAEQGAARFAVGQAVV